MNAEDSEDSCDSQKSEVYNPKDTTEHRLTPMLDEIQKQFKAHNKEFKIEKYKEIGEVKIDLKKILTNPEDQKWCGLSIEKEHPEYKEYFELKTSLGNKSLPADKVAEMKQKGLDPKMLDLNFKDVREPAK